MGKNQYKVFILSIIWSTKLSGEFLTSTWTHFSSSVGTSRVASWEVSKELGMKWPTRWFILSSRISLSPCSKTNTRSLIIGTTCGGSFWGTGACPLTNISLYSFFRAEQVTTPDFPSFESLKKWWFLIHLILSFQNVIIHLKKLINRALSCLFYHFNWE